MRSLRLILYFLVGLLLGGVSVLAKAESVWSDSTSNPNPPFYATAQDLCNKKAADWWAANPSYAANYELVVPTPMTTLSSTYYQCDAQKKSKSGGALSSIATWYAKQWTITSCVAPKIRNMTTGACVDPPSCVAEDLGEGWYARGKDEMGLSNNDYCESGCVVQLSLVIGSSSDYYYNSTTRWDKYAKARTATTCTGSTPTPTGATTPPKDPEKKPPCAKGEGVITTSSGQVLCVPVATSPDQPKVNTSTKKTDYPDGSSTTTTTTQTCTGEGACSTTTITNTTGVGGGTTPGQAGTPGVTGSTEDDAPSDTSDFCAKNPSLQVCKGGMSEEGTQKQVLAEVKKLSSVDSSTDKSAITSTKSYTSTEGYEAAKAKDDELLNFANGTTKNASVEASKTTFEQALSSGFWSDIPTASCTTPTYVIAGHAIEWSRWCEIVGMIQEIGAYGMWVMLAISIFVMLSGGRQT